MMVRARVKKRLIVLVSTGAVLLIGVLVLWRIGLPSWIIGVDSADLPDSAIAATSEAVITVGGYYRLSIDTAELSQTEIRGSEVFYATFKSKTACIQDLPVSPSQSRITASYVAIHQVNGAHVTLNPGHTAIVEPVPSREGDVAEIEQAVPLQFPSVCESGDYEVVAEIVEAEVRVLFFWIDVSGYVPSSMTMGSVTYIPSP